MSTYSQSFSRGPEIPATAHHRTGSGETAARWTVEAAYGFPALGGRFTGSPHAGIGFMGDGRDVTVGWRLSRVSSGVPDVSFGVRATRRESMGTAPAHGVGFEVIAAGRARRTFIKVLYLDRSGYYIWSKRLERG